MARSRSGWLALLALIALLITAAELWRVSRQSKQETIAVSSQTTTLMDSLNQLRAAVAAKDSTIAAMVGPSMRVIDLGSYSSVNPVARMFWDQKTQEWTLYASRVKQPPAGRIYQVWLIARGHSDPISAGTFSPDSNGSAVARARYGLEAGTLRRIVVTEERAGGARYPTGPIVFAGNAP
jgi:anti-sigma-K factor RskA